MEFLTTNGIWLGPLAAAVITGLIATWRERRKAADEEDRDRAAGAKDVVEGAQTVMHLQEAAFEVMLEAERVKNRAALEAQEIKHRIEMAALTERVEALEESQGEKTERILAQDMKIVALETEIKMLNRWIAVLIEQISKLGGVPISLADIEHLDGFGGPSEGEKSEESP